MDWAKVIKSLEYQAAKQSEINSELGCNDSTPNILMSIARALKAGLKGE